MSGGEVRLQVVARDAAIERDLAAFVDAQYPRLIRLAGLICRDAIDSEDAVQSSLERAWRHRDSLQDPQRLAAWLDRIVVREAIRLGRDRRSLRERVERLFGDHDDIGVRVPTVGPDPGSVVPSRAALRHAFEALPAAQRAVVALHLYLGYSISETAEMVGAPLETVRSRLRLARAQLRFELGEALR